MVLLSGNKIKKSFTEKVLLDSIDITIHEGDKIGLVGINGTGKTTLLKIVAGEYEAEEGEIIKSRELHSTYLPQNPKYDPEMTVIEQAIEYLEESGRPFQQYQCEKMLRQLGIKDFQQSMKKLSGGQRKRVAMASVLTPESNLLILDEPTNHMDNDAILWLENFLINYKGALFMITHDRYFLDRVTNRITEIDSGKLYIYDGNYNYYIESKMARRESDLASERKRQSIYRKELEWIRRGAQARATKAKGRIERFHRLESDRLTIEDNSLELTTASSRLGKKVIEIREVSKSYSGKTLFQGFSYTLLRNDRVGIIGPNGCGKSTLLSVIMGNVPPDSGTIEMGDTVRIGCFSQENQVLDENQRVIKFISEIAENINTADGSFSASQMLERFLFPTHMHSIEVGRLSGGEKRRLYLLSILMRAPNVLILDEPTNDLDIETLTILEDYLDDFQGAVIAVSHDRYFLDRVIQKTFSFDEGTEISLYNGGYSDYSQTKEEERKVASTENEEKESVKLSEKSEKTERCTGTNRDGRPKKLRFTYDEKKEYETIETDIQELEEKINSISNEMLNVNTDFVKLSKLSEEKDELDELLTRKFERWEYLTELAERIDAQ